MAANATPETETSERERAETREGTKEETEGNSIQRVVGVVTVTFSAILFLAAVSYSVTVNVVDWVTVDVLTYPVEGIAPFVVISGAILTIPVLLPTVLVSVRFLE